MELVEQSEIDQPNADSGKDPQSGSRERADHGQARAQEKTEQDCGIPLGG